MSVHTVECVDRRNVLLLPRSLMDGTPAGQRWPASWAS